MESLNQNPSKHNSDPGGEAPEGSTPNSANLPAHSPEIIDGIIRVGQFTILCGYYNVGKTPLLRDLAFHVCNGLTWLGRPVSKRKVVLLDFETAPVDYEEDMLGLDIRYGGQCSYPDARLLLARERSVGITPLRGISHKEWWERPELIRDLLRESPDALVIIDPAEHLFSFNRNRSTHVLSLFIRLRELLTEFPLAAIFLVMNLRKRGLRRNPPRLLAEPLLWLEDNAGDLDLLNRCDVRLGFDFHDDPTLRVIHGARRRESMQPIIVKQVEISGLLCGFERVEMPLASLELGLTKHQREQWRRLPSEFRFIDTVARDIVPRSSLSRLINAARSIGLLTSQDGVHRKL